MSQQFVSTEPPPPPFIIHEPSSHDNNTNNANNQQAPFHKGRFKKPVAAREGQVHDIEDIIINGVARPRPDKVPWLCTFRRRLIPEEKYVWCQCGKSADIYCDETCQNEPTKLGALEFSVQHKVSQHGLCGCRYTATPPFCDGCHIYPHLGVDEWVEKYPEDRDKQWWLNNTTNNDSNNNCGHSFPNKEEIGCNKENQGDKKCQDTQTTCESNPTSKKTDLTPPSDNTATPQ